jgi:hypothetical protein
MHSPDLLYLIVLLGLGVSPYEAARVHHRHRRNSRSVAARGACTLKSAKALGITVPLPLSGRADELIE